MILHTGFNIKLNLTENEIKTIAELTKIDINKIETLNIQTLYTCVKFYKDSDPISMQYWYKKQKITTGYIKAIYFLSTKKNDTLVGFMVVDSLQLYINLIVDSFCPPADIKRMINNGKFGNKIDLPFPIKVDCIPSITSI